MACAVTDDLLPRLTRPPRRSEDPGAATHRRMGLTAGYIFIYFQVIRDD